MEPKFQLATEPVFSDFEPDQLTFAKLAVCVKLHSLYQKVFCKQKCNSFILRSRFEKVEIIKLYKFLQTSTSIIQMRNQNQNI